MLKKLILPGWIIGIFLLFLYSYTQVDLSLTLSQASIFQTIQKSFQYIGYFNRPLSTYLYIGIFSLLFVLYFSTLRLVNKERISRRTVWTIIIGATVLLSFSYTAFSYDIFNYIFDARIITEYGKNPYLYKALDFPNDPMLSFMHWTHRTYPYGPVWLLFTVPLTFIGGNFFFLTFFLFKLLISSFFLITIYFIEKITKNRKNISSTLAIAAFGLNPFIISESLVSSHNDIVMMGLALGGVYYLLNNSKAIGFSLSILSVGIKFATAILILPYVIFRITKSYSRFLTISLFVMIIAVILATLRTNFQPWYLLYAAPFVALMFDKRIVRIPAVIMSIVSVVYYIPYLYTGGWDTPIPTILNTLVMAATICSFFISISLLVRRSSK